MKVYICPMHHEITQNKPGRCSKCGMDLVLKEEMNVKRIENKDVEKSSYMPLIVIVGLILLTSLTISYTDLQSGFFNLKDLISYFMTGFFLVFSGFKLIDLKGFAQGYYTYDLLAQRWFSYGYIYPFIELFFGLGMILLPESSVLLLAEAFVMLFSGLGVATKLAKHEKFQCACLGTFLKVPLTKVTLVEDFGMALLALILILVK